MSCSSLFCPVYLSKALGTHVSIQKIRCGARSPMQSHQPHCAWHSTERKHKLRNEHPRHRFSNHQSNRKEINKQIPEPTKLRYTNLPQNPPKHRQTYPKTYLFFQANSKTLPKHRPFPLSTSSASASGMPRF